ncbi:hypothetical protein N8586_05265 [Verrucomicrobiales bacterium]|nr:hypothetical protein [Verrucomicrobiales bacterium]MDA7614524.1 hypothetical protein [Verrucomicrobiales bacterium]
MSTSLRVTGKAWGDIDGRDEDLRLAASVVPTADPRRRGGEEIDLSLGINVKMPGRFLSGQRLAAEIGVPIYRSLDGPQLITDWFFNLGWQWAF